MRTSRFRRALISEVCDGSCFLRSQFMLNPGKNVISVLLLNRHSLCAEGFLHKVTFGNKQVVKIPNRFVRKAIFRHCYRKGSFCDFHFRILCLIDRGVALRLKKGNQVFDVFLWPIFRNIQKAFSSNGQVANGVSLFGHSVIVAFHSGVLRQGLAKVLSHAASYVEINCHGMYHPFFFGTYIYHSKRHK